MTTPNGFDTCQGCNGRTLVSGWKWCEQCSMKVGMVPISIVADCIVAFDQQGALESERSAFWLLHGVKKNQLAAAQEIAEERYAAARIKRKRYRGW